VVAHFNHQLRGKEADADERLVRRIAKSRGLRVLVGTASVKAYARQRKWALEMAARELRHGFLAEAAKKAGASVVALATQPDKAACDLHLPEGKPVEIHLKLGRRDPLDWAGETI